MEKTELRSLPDANGQKRQALEELNTAPDAKRSKAFHDGSIKSDVKSSNNAQRVPFPEKES